MQYKESGSRTDNTSQICVCRYSSRVMESDDNLHFSSSILQSFWMTFLACSAQQHKYALPNLGSVVTRALLLWQYPPLAHGSFTYYFTTRLKLTQITLNMETGNRKTTRDSCQTISQLQKQAMPWSPLLRPVFSLAREGSGMLLCSAQQHKYALPNLPEV